LEEDGKQIERGEKTKTQKVTGANLGISGIFPKLRI
jgi:hypothetical protein